jgi:hypothetical protein
LLSFVIILCLHNKTGFAIRSVHSKVEFAFTHNRVDFAVAIHNQEVVTKHFLAGFVLLNEGNSLVVDGTVSDGLGL